MSYQIGVLEERNQLTKPKEEEHDNSDIVEAAVFV